MELNNITTLQLTDADVRALRNLARIGMLEIERKKKGGSQGGDYTRGGLHLEFGEVKQAQALAERLWKSL